MKFQCSIRFHGLSPIRNISYLLPMCHSFWEKCINSQKNGMGCSTPLTAHSWQKWKSTFLSCPRHEIYREETVCVKNSNYILIDPKQISVVLKSEKKKKVLSSFLIFVTFPPSIFNFPPSLISFFDFPSFLPHFPFFLASLFPTGQQKFPGQKPLQGHLPPCPTPRLLRHCMQCSFPFSIRYLN